MTDLRELIEELRNDEVRQNHAGGADPLCEKAALAIQSLSERIAVLEGERAAAIEICDTSVTQCPFSKDRAPASSKPCPKCAADSTEPCRKQVRAAFEAVQMMKSAQTP